jgi:hypothetical protein
MEKFMSDHEENIECPNCALAEKILDVLRADAEGDPIFHMLALSTVMQAVLHNTLLASEDDMPETTQGTA